jgi:hydroxymethylpyrimidine pyrophosphatase-like HAD family hydrolase
VNDVPVLSSVGLAVAMGNAPAEVKAVADYVTLDANHSGVAQAIRKFLFMEEGKRI